MADESRPFVKVMDATVFLARVPVDKEAGYTFNDKVQIYITRIYIITEYCLLCLL